MSLDVEAWDLKVKSQRDFHFIIGNARLNTSLGSHLAEPRRELAFVAGDNFRAAMADDRTRYLPNAPLPRRRVLDCIQ